MDGGRQEGRGREIALDIARGLAFLHQMQLVHFDVKSPNGGQLLLRRVVTMWCRANLPDCFYSWLPSFDAAGRWCSRYSARVQ